jgi:hypothetical protein
MFVGIIVLGLGEVLSGWTVNNIAAFFVTVGFVMGVGTSLIFMVSEARLGASSLRRDKVVDALLPLFFSPSHVRYSPRNTF